jgi:hypothetical protein
MRAYIMSNVSPDASIADLDRLLLEGLRIEEGR